MKITTHHYEIKKGFWNLANTLSFYCFDFRSHPSGWSPQAFWWIAQECHVESVTFGGWENKVFKKIDWYEIQCVIPKINSTRSTRLCNTRQMWASSLDHEINLLENKVCQFCVGCVKFNFCFFIFNIGALEFRHFVLTNAN